MFLFVHVQRGIFYKFDIVLVPYKNNVPSKFVVLQI